ncbi:hypothetical protein LEMLEM_LOCUS22608 [Lemmus lemmus]
MIKPHRILQSGLDHNSKFSLCPHKIICCSKVRPPASGLCSQLPAPFCPQITTRKLYYLKYCLAISSSLFWLTLLRLPHLHSSVWHHEVVAYREIS